MVQLVLASLAYLFVIFLAITCFHYSIHQQMRRRIRVNPNRSENSREDSTVIVNGIIVDEIPEDAIVVDAE